MRKSVKIMLIILAALTVVVGAGALAARLYLGRARYQRDEDVAVNEEAYEGLSETVTEKKLHPEDVYDLSGVRPLTDEEAENTYTLLVIGGDEAKERKDAEAVITVSINHRTKEVVCYSFDTSLYVVIPEHGGGRLGNAYAVGGGPLLERTMEENYGMRIDNYASISFKDVARILEMPEFEELDLSRDGLKVVKELVYSLGAVKGGQVAAYITSLLPYVTHNLDSEQMMRVILQIPRIIPYYGVDGMLPGDLNAPEMDGYLVPDPAEMAGFIREKIYGEGRVE